MGKGNGVKLAKSIASAKVIAQLRVLVAENAAVPEFNVAGEKGADAELGGGTDDREGGGLDADFAGAFPLAPAADGKPLGPAEVFAVVGMDEFRFAVVGRGGGGLGVQARPLKSFSRRPRSRRRRCKGPRRTCRSRTTLRRPRISGGRPRPAGRDRRRSEEGRESPGKANEP